MYSLLNLIAHSMTTVSAFISLPKLFIFALVLSSSLIRSGSVALSGCHGKCSKSDSSVPFSFGVMFVLAPLVLSTWTILVKHRKKMEHHRITLFDRNGGNLLKKKLSKRKKRGNAQLKIYTAQDVKTATDNYSTDRKVMRRCNQGTFYRGNLGDLEVLVVMIPEVIQSKVKQFVDELIFLSLPHRNLVKLLGCCLETSSPLLVYELHGDGDVTVFDKIRDLTQFSCKQRAKAAAAAARGLAYLQSRNQGATAAAFFHGNVCSCNIFLDASFGHAKLFYAAASSLIDRDRNAGFDLEKSDVYRFGVVLVELFSRRTAESLQESDGNLNTWLTGIEEEWSEEEGGMVKEVAAMAAKCLSVRSEERPSMRELEARPTALDFDREERIQKNYRVKGHCIWLKL